MKDAFGNKIEKDDRILYSTKTGAGTVYVVGKAVALKASTKTTPDKVEVEPEKVSVGHYTFIKNPSVYASNCVVLKSV